MRCNDWLSLGESCSQRASPLIPFEQATVLVSPAGLSYVRSKETETVSSLWESARGMARSAVARVKAKSFMFELARIAAGTGGRRARGVVH